MNLPNTYLSILKDKGFEVVEGKSDKLWGTAYTFRKGTFSCCIDSGTNFEDFMSFLDNKVSDVETLYEDENLCQIAEEYAACYQELVNLTEMYYEKIHLLKKRIQSRAGD